MGIAVTRNQPLLTSSILVYVGLTLNMNMQTKHVLESSRQGQNLMDFLSDMLDECFTHGQGSKVFVIR
jgi:hypothetical protein